jgi:hypothetical protein
MDKFFERDGVCIYNADCLAAFAELADHSIDAVITDPPYAEIDRDYGRLTECAWHSLMRSVVTECRRVLKPTGSAVFILQPNSERVGRMRPWLWEFMAWTAREWNQVQDCWWWNICAAPTVHCQRTRGLMRPSVKACVWLGPSDCVRNQDAILWEESDATKARKIAGRATNKLEHRPSGMTMRAERALTASSDRGGVTPFNLLPIAGSSSSNTITHSHGAQTPAALLEWWVRYISPPGGTVLDCFNGSGTTGEVCQQLGRNYIGFEKELSYCEMTRERFAEGVAA